MKRRKNIKKLKRRTRVWIVLSICVIVIAITAIIKANTKPQSLETEIPETEEVIHHRDVIFISEAEASQLPEKTGDKIYVIMLDDDDEASYEGQPVINEDSNARISPFEPGKIYYYLLSSKDKNYIARAVYQESRGEPFEGKVAVASVILNRFFSEDNRFSHTSIYDVIAQETQFADISRVTSEMLEAEPECMKAVENACKGWDPTRKWFLGGAVFFYSIDSDLLSEESLKEREGIEVFQIGRHNFHVDLND